MDQNQFDILSSKLTAIVVLLAGDRFKDKPKKEAILFLKELGLYNTTIALCVGSTPGSVAVAVSQAKKVNKD